jgi:tRNA/rRNA methyltransferase
MQSKTSFFLLNLTQFMAMQKRACPSCVNCIDASSNEPFCARKPGLMEIVWILVGTKSPENLGASARALKTMGFSELRLVAPCDFAEGPARWMAVHSHDILDQAQVYPSLESAISDCDVCVGTTAKARHRRHTSLSPQELSQNLSGKAEQLSRVALVFGPENTGLTNTDLACCDLLTTIPLAAPQPSLNLAQAVMVYSYVLNSLAPLAHYSRENKEQSYGALKQKIEQTADDFGINQDPRIMAWLRERLPLLAGRDLRMLFNLLKKLEQAGLSKTAAKRSKF